MRFAVSGFLLGALTLLSAGSAQLAAAGMAALSPGAGQFEFIHRAGAAERSIKVWTYRPKILAAETLVLFVMHGAERDGARYRDQWRPHAERAQALLLVPEFAAASFPGGRHYSAPRTNASNQADGAAPFVFAAIEEIFDQVTKTNRLTAGDYRLYGHSAGAQFVHRFILANSRARAKIAVAANAGWYMMPEYETEFPYGLRGSGLSEDSVKVALAKKLIVLLGEKDTDPQHAQLNRSAQAKLQGANRLERGKNFFRAAERQAQKLQVGLSWELRTVANVAHSNAGMARAAAPLLFQ